MSVAPASFADSTTPIGRAAIAVANSPDKREVGCAMCGYLAQSLDARGNKHRDVCKKLILLS